jgi:putative FmdB family regulatory protein
MPTYQYLCEHCGAEFERKQSFHDEPVAACPECGGKVRRVIAPVGVIFKGSGWYVTDSRRKSTVGSAPTSGTDKPATEKPAADGGADGSGTATEGKSGGTPASSGDGGGKASGAKDAGASKPSAA